MTAEEALAAVTQERNYLEREIAEARALLREVLDEQYEIPEALCARIAALLARLDEGRR